MVQLLVEGDISDLSLRKDMANRFGEASGISPEEIFVVRGRSPASAIDRRRSREYLGQIRELMSSVSKV